MGAILVLQSPGNREYR